MTCMAKGRKPSCYRGSACGSRGRQTCSQTVTFALHDGAVDDRVSPGRLTLQQEVMAMSTHAPNRHKPEYTHQIEDGDGEWIWMGPQFEMEVIFRNLTGENFEGKPAERHAQYLAQMRHSNGEAWPGRADPFEPGKTIKLVKLSGEVLKTHVFPSVDGPPSPIG
ncbi:hypothetical protein Bpfe_031096 [Biomphalaria pfeifferi]|uniref:DUF7688 domain-containing protein n=1 Tax=Biomphalaria pfeifferi TaxID=112525 RepID=A0AAD8ANJ1_BIOPF|nr:hypothetical protein Bpfe_031096 [Biomphalaria pfeifferi]